MFLFFLSFFLLTVSYIKCFFFFNMYVGFRRVYMER